MNETLEHHGILGMKWGVRRYQNKDGTWTEEGKEHRNGSMTADDYFKLSSTERVDSPIGKELLSGESYKKYVSACEKQEDLENKALADKASDFYDTAHAVAENYKAKAGENYDQETYDYYDKDGGLDAHNKILNEYAKVNEEYGKARKDEEDAIDALYEEAGPISKKYFGDEYRLSYQDVNELAWDRMQTDKLDETKHSNTSSEDSLMHYGILGMKWGIRRYQNSDGSLTAAGRKRYGDDTPDSNSSSSGNSSDATPRTPAKSASEMTDQELNQALNRLRMEQQYNELTGAKSSNQYQNQQNFSTPPSNTGNLSNAELQSYINRLNMEKQYKQLTAPPPKQLTNGQKFLKEVIPAVAMEVGRELVKSTMKKMLGLSGDNNENKNNNNNNDNNNKNNNNNNNNNNNKNNNDALNKLRGRLDESDKRMNLIKNSIESLDKNMKTLSNKSNEDRKQTESIQKEFLDFMKKNAQQIQQEEKKNNDALRAEWKSNAGSQKSDWSYGSGSDNYSYYENPWTYRVNKV